MLIISNDEVRALANWELVINAVRDAFKAEAAGQGHAWPVVLGEGTREGHVLGFKSGIIKGDNPLIGVKVGAYWPSNTERGQPAHSSNTILYDDETGRPSALIAGGYLNCMRTAAADAVAVDLLAREDAKTLCLIGAGHQAYFEALAIAQVRTLERIIISGRTKSKALGLAKKLQNELGIVCELGTLEDKGPEVDIVVTVTPSKEPLFDAKGIPAGVHISAMGADTVGKIELPTELYSKAHLFADHIPQSITIGEFQNVEPVKQREICAIGDVILGKASGRKDKDAITIFDSSGIALQDLTVANAILETAKAKGSGSKIDL